MLPGDDPGGELRQEARLEFGAGAIHADRLVGRRSQQQEAIGGNPSGLHVGIDDGGSRGDGFGKIGAVGADDQSGIGQMQEVEPTPDADDPFAMFDIQLASGTAQGVDVLQVALQQRQQIAADVAGHVGAHLSHALIEFGAFGKRQLADVESGTIAAVDDE